MPQITAITGGHSQVPGVVTVDGGWDGNVDEENLTLRFGWGYAGAGGSFGTKTSPQHSTEISGTYGDSFAVDYDRYIKFRAEVILNGDQTDGPSSGQFKTYSTEPSAATPVITNITAHTADAQCSFDAGQLSTSTFNCQLYYRRYGDPSWIPVGSVVTSGTSISAALSGLLSGTKYQVKMVGQRTTENTPTWESPVANFDTIAESPTITTELPTVVTQSQATLNGSINPNNLAVRVRFGWGNNDAGSDPLLWDTLTGYQIFTGNTVQYFSQLINSLTPSTQYFFRAFVEWPSPGYANGTSGVTRSFTTTGVPPPPPVGWEDQMHFPQFDGHYGVQTDVYFTLQQPSATSNDLFVTDPVGTWYVAGDIKISKDGGALTNCTNTPTQVTAGAGLYKLVLTATEMQAELIYVVIHDAAGTAYRDLYLLCRTKERLGQSIINASQIGGSAPALQLQPSTGGYGLNVLNAAGDNIGDIKGFLQSNVLRANVIDTGGANPRLDSGASGTNDYYNGDILMIVSGSAIGQSRIIKDYVGATKEVTPNAAWSVNPALGDRFVIIPGPRVTEGTIDELTAIPSITDTLAKKIQFIYQRFALKIDQTATTQQMYKSDSSTVLGSRSVSDNGTTQVIAKIT